VAKADARVHVPGFIVIVLPALVNNVIVPVVSHSTMIIVIVKKKGLIFQVE
jgi:hypothetical protein